MKVNIILVAGLVAFSAGAASRGAVIHVSGTAPLGGDGSEARPFCPLHEAVAAARKMPGSREIAVADGRYFFDRTLSLNARDSGLAIRAAHPGKAVLTGGVKRQRHMSVFRHLRAAHCAVRRVRPPRGEAPRAAQGFPARAGGRVAAARGRNVRRGLLARRLGLHQPGCRLDAVQLHGAERRLPRDAVLGESLGH